MLRLCYYILGKVSNHEKLLVAESSYCKNEGNAENMCFSFSTDDLCERPRTDHNYYAICAVSRNSNYIFSIWPSVNNIHNLLHAFSGTSCSNTFG